MVPVQSTVQVNDNEIVAARSVVNVNGQDTTLTGHDPQQLPDEARDGKLTGPGDQYDAAALVDSGSPHCGLSANVIIRSDVLLPEPNRPPRHGIHQLTDAHVPVEPIGDRGNFTLPVVCHQNQKRISHGLPPGCEG